MWNWLADSLLGRAVDAAISLVTRVHKRTKARAAIRGGNLFSDTTLDGRIFAAIAKCADEPFMGINEIPSSIRDWLLLPETKRDLSEYFLARLASNADMTSESLRRIACKFEIVTGDRRELSLGYVEAVANYVLVEIADSQGLAMSALAEIVANQRQKKRPSPFGTSAALQARLLSFRNAYTRSHEGLIPFGGRATELHTLNRWIAQNSLKRRLLLTAPTGRGKSALLVHWTASLQQLGSSWNVIFVPISIRFGTSRPEVFYALLAMQLASLLDAPLEPAIADADVHFLGASSVMLQEAIARHLRVLIVIDGLDEVDAAPFDSSIFPVELPENVRVLLSARELATDAGHSGWLRRLEWSEKYTETLALRRLDLTGTIEVGRRAGLDINRVGRQILVRVFHLSEGEPLLVRLYVEDLNEILSSASSIDIDNLSNLRPGFKAYFARWLEDQVRAWKMEGEMPDGQTVDATFAILSSALGPLEGTDLLTLVSKLTSSKRPLSVDRLIRPVARFVIGDGTALHGFVLSHPKLSEYLREDYLDRLVVVAAKQEFVAWGQQLTAELAEKEELELPSYLLQNYAQHLISAQAPFQDFCPLLTRGWKRARQAFEGGHRGLANDVRAASQSVGALRLNDPELPRRFAVRFRAQLWLSSIRSIGSNCPDQLLELGLSCGVIAPHEALAYVEMQQPGENRIQYLVSIASSLPHDEIESLIYSIGEVSDPGNRCAYLIKILKALPLDRRTALIDDVCALIGEISEPSQALDAIANLLPLVPDARRVQELWARAAALPSLRHLVRLRALRSASEAYKRIELMPPFDLATECQRITDALTDPIEKLDAIELVVDLLPASYIQTILTNLAPILGQLQQASSHEARDWHGIKTKMRWERDSRTRVAFILLSARELEDDEYATALDLIEQLLEHAPMMPMSRVDLLSSRLSQIRPSFILRATRKCWEWARQLPKGNNQVHSMTKLAGAAPISYQKDIVAEAFRNVRLIDDLFAQGLALLSIFKEFSIEDKRNHLTQLETMVRRVPYVVHRAKLLIDLAGLVPNPRPDLYVEAAELIQMADDLYSRNHELIYALDVLPPGVRQAIFPTCLEHVLNFDNAFISFRLAVLVDKAIDLWTIEHLEKALAVVSQLAPAESLRGFASLVPLAAHLQRSDIVEEAVARASTMADADSKVSATVRIAPHLSDLDRRRLVEGTTEMVLSLPPSLRINFLVRLLPLVGEEGRHRFVPMILADGAGLSGSWSALSSILGYASSAEERARIQKLAFDKANEAPVSQRTGALTGLISNADPPAKQLELIDAILAEGAPNRSAMLSAFMQWCPVIAKLSQPELLRGAFEEICDAGAIWP